MVPFYYILLTIFPPLRMPVSNVLRSLTTHPQPCGTPTTSGIIPPTRLPTRRAYRGVMNRSLHHPEVRNGLQHKHSTSQSTPRRTCRVTLTILSTQTSVRVFIIQKYTMAFNACQASCTPLPQSLAIISA